MITPAQRRRSSGRSPWRRPGGRRPGRLARVSTRSMWSPLRWKRRPISPGPTPASVSRLTRRSSGRRFPRSSMSRRYCLLARDAAAPRGLNPSRPWSAAWLLRLPAAPGLLLLLLLGVFGRALLFQRSAGFLGFARRSRFGCHGPYGTAPGSWPRARRRFGPVALTPEVPPRTPAWRRSRAASSPTAPR